MLRRPLVTGQLRRLRAAAIVHDRQPARPLVGERMRFLVVLCALIFCASAHAQQARAVGELISGAARALDGVTFDIGRDRIRIWGIDAPKRRAWCVTSGKKWRPARGSIAALKGCLRETTVTCRVQKIERRWGTMWFDRSAGGTKTRKTLGPAWSARDGRPTGQATQAAAMLPWKDGPRASGAGSGGARVPSLL